MARRKVAEQVSVVEVTEKVAPIDNLALTEEVVQTKVSSAAVALEIDQEALNQFGSNKSAMIRYLASQGYKTSPIAKALSLRFGREVKYQQVRNVLQQAMTLKGNTSTVGQTFENVAEDREEEESDE